MLNLHRDKKFMGREPGRDEKILHDDGQDGSVPVVVVVVVVVVVCMVTHTYSKSMDQQGKVASPARGQLYRKMNISLSAFVPENLVSRDGFGSPVIVGGIGNLAR